MQPPRRGVLFLCVANAARSQMAEGWAQRLAPPEVAVWSAGSMPARLSSYAVRAMQEVGVDISGQRSKGIDEIPLDEVDTIVTLCQEEVCPVVPDAVARLHWPFEAPGWAARTPDEVLESYRRIRDGIRQKIEELFRE